MRTSVLLQLAPERSLKNHNVGMGPILSEENSRDMDLPSRVTREV